MVKDAPSSLEKIIIGAGEQRWDGWTPTQQAELDLTDPASFAAYFASHRASALLCEHVWEHLTLAQGQAAARLCFEYLCPGSLLRAAVPDAYFPNAEYQRLVQVGGSGQPNDPAADHQVVYTPALFAGLFRAAGFEVSVLEYHDEHGNFHALPWRPEDGPIYRSALLDHRNAAYRNAQGPLGFASIVLDARKPLTPP